MSKYQKTDTDEIYEGISRNENPDWLGWHTIDNLKKWDNFEDLLNKGHVPGLHDAVELHNIKHPIPPNYTDIDELVAEHEKDDERREALEQARERLHDIARKNR